MRCQAAELEPEIQEFMRDRQDVVIVGGGVIGLAIAHHLCQAGRAVLLLEKNAHLGAETSSHNSEVIHAGIYYEPGSLRAKFCVDGKARLYNFCRDHGVPVQHCGKLIVATSPEETLALNGLLERGRKNGVTDLVSLSPRAAQELEPDVVCTAAGLSPSTGVIDSHALLQALEARALDRGGTIVLRTTAQKITPRDNGIEIETVSERGDAHTVLTHTLINAAGLGATALSKTLPPTLKYAPPNTYFAKGHYFSYAGATPFKHLIYPMPNPSALGIHLTRDCSGVVKFGPDLSWTENPSYAFEDGDGARQQSFAAAIRRYWPDIDASKLQPESTGIRPKLTQAGEPMVDFAIHTQRQHGVPGYIALYGIESPGLTSCLAIADYVGTCLDHKNKN